MALMNLNDQKICEVSHPNHNSFSSQLRTLLEKNEGPSPDHPHTTCIQSQFRRVTEFYTGERDRWCPNRRRGRWIRFRRCKSASSWLSGRKGVVAKGVTANAHYKNTCVGLQNITLWHIWKTHICLDLTQALVLKWQHKFSEEETYHLMYQSRMSYPLRYLNNV